MKYDNVKNLKTLQARHKLFLFLGICKSKNDITYLKASIFFKYIIFLDFYFKYLNLKR